MTDLISRKAAKEAVCSMCRWEGTSNCDECEHPVDELPPINPVKHGKWIEEPNCWYRCSNCGQHYPSMRGYMYYNYCPHCGAKMDGGEE